MCFGDQATLPINRGHNTRKKRRKISQGNNFKTEKFRATKNKPKPKLFLPSQPTASLPLQKRLAAASPSFGSLWLLLKPSAPPSLGSPFPRSPLSWPLTHFRALLAVALHGANAPSLFWQIPEGFPLILQFLGAYFVIFELYLIHFKFLLF